MRKMKKVIATILAVTMCVSLAACGNSNENKKEATESAEEQTEEITATENESENAGAEETRSLKIGFTANSLENATVQESLAVLQKKCDEKGWELTPIDYKADLSTCITTIENFTTAGCDIIMFQCPDAEGVKDVVTRAQEAGIIVVAYDTTADYFDYYLTQSDEEIGTAIGTMAAEYVNEHLDGKATAVAIGLPSNPILLTREQAFTKAFTENCDGEVVDSIDGGKYMGDMASIAEIINSAHPETKIILCIADIVNVSMIDTFKSLGYSNTEGNFAMFGCDCIEETRALWNGENGDDIMIQGSVWTGLPDALDDAFDRATGEVLTGEKGEAQIAQTVTAVTPENYKEVFGE